MKLGDDILKLLNQTYAANSMIERHVGRYHLNYKTDAFGRPVLLFLGKHSRSGKIKSERFTRHIVTDATGKVIKDHWDNKGKT